MNQFIATINDIRQGQIADEMGDQLAALVKAVRETGGKASLSLKLTIKPASKNNTEQLVVTDEIVATKPKPERGTTILFSTEEGNLSRRDPRQPELPMRGQARIVGEVPRAVPPPIDQAVEG